MHRAGWPVNLQKADFSGSSRIAFELPVTLEQRESVEPLRTSMRAFITTSR
jgi:hypothetical protein